MQPTKKLLIPVAAIAALGLISACHNNSSNSPARPGNQAVVQAAPADATAAVATQSGPVNFVGYAHEDDSPMTAEELARTVAEVPAIGADYNKLQTASQGQINSDGTITLTDSAGNAIDVTPADTTIQSYTFAAVQDNTAVGYTADGATSADQSQAQAQAQAQAQETCSAQRLVFDLSGTEQPAASQEQAQAQAQAQEEKKELKTRGMHVYLLMPCQEVKQEAKQEQEESKAIAPESKQESKEVQESKDVQQSKDLVPEAKQESK